MLAILLHTPSIPAFCLYFPDHSELHVSGEQIRTLILLSSMLCSLVRWKMFGLRVPKHERRFCGKNRSRHPRCSRRDCFLSGFGEMKRLLNGRLLGGNVLAVLAMQAKRESLLLSWSATRRQLRLSQSSLLSLRDAC